MEDADLYADLELSNSEEEGDVARDAISIPEADQGEMDLMDEGLTNQFKKRTPPKSAPPPRVDIHVEKLKHEVATLKQENEILQKNLVLLYKTAHHIFTLKDKELNNLRTKYDAMCFRKRNEANPTALPSIAPRDSRPITSTSTRDHPPATSTSRRPSRPPMSEEFSMLRNYVQGLRRPDPGAEKRLAQTHTEVAKKDSLRTADSSVGRGPQDQNLPVKTNSSGHRGHTNRQSTSPDRCLSGSHKRLDDSERRDSRSRSPTKLRQSSRNLSPGEIDPSKEDRSDRKRRHISTCGAPETKRSRNEHFAKAEASKRCMSKIQGKNLGIHESDEEMSSKQNKDAHFNEVVRGNGRKHAQGNRPDDCREKRVVDSHKNKGLDTPGRSSSGANTRMKGKNGSGTPRGSDTPCRSRSADTPTHKRDDTPSQRRKEGRGNEDEVTPRRLGGSTRRNTVEDTPSRRNVNSQKAAPMVTPERRKKDSRTTTGSTPTGRRENSRNNRDTLRERSQSGPQHRKVVDCEAGDYEKIVKKQTAIPAKKGNGDFPGKPNNSSRRSRVESTTNDCGTNLFGNEILDETGRDISSDTGSAAISTAKPNRSMRLNENNELPDLHIEDTIHVKGELAAEPGDKTAKTNKFENSLRNHIFEITNDTNEFLDTFSYADFLGNDSPAHAVQPQPTKPGHADEPISRITGVVPNDSVTRTKQDIIHNTSISLPTEKAGISDSAPAPVPMELRRSPRKLMKAKAEAVMPVVTAKYSPGIPTTQESHETAKNHFPGDVVELRRSPRKLIRDRQTHGAAELPNLGALIESPHVPRPDPIRYKRKKTREIPLEPIGICQDPRVLFRPPRPRLLAVIYWGSSEMYFSSETRSSFESAGTSNPSPRRSPRKLQAKRLTESDAALLQSLIDHPPTMQYNSAPQWDVETPPYDPEKGEDLLSAMDSETTYGSRNWPFEEAYDPSKPPETPGKNLSFGETSSKRGEDGPDLTFQF